MIVEQIYTGCLAQGAYYIESNGEAAVIDPLREVQPYLARAKQNNAQIKYVLETHFHADFVSGHLDLAAATGAVIVYGPTAVPSFNAHVTHDQEELALGDVRIRVLHTPGHTMESCCYLLIDEHGTEQMLFSGDTLFIGDVGRPDLAQKINAALTQEKLAGYLYDSLRTKIMTLPDELIIYPAHGAGSACGKNMSRETSDTLGHQKATNYALRAGLSKEQFIREVLEGQTPPPGYFPQNVRMNISGYEPLDIVLKRGLQPLDLHGFEAAAQQNDVLILDTRSPGDFKQGFIPGSIFIGIDGSFASWAGTLIPDIRQQILLIADQGREAEVVTRLARVGYDHCIGYLNGGFNAWRSAGKPIDYIPSVNPETLADMHHIHTLSFLDVRKPGEYEQGHIKEAISSPLDFVNDPDLHLHRSRAYYVYCASGYRSVIFISLLRARGFDRLTDVQGGFKALKESCLFPVYGADCATITL